MQVTRGFLLAYTCLGRQADVKTTLLEYLTATVRKGSQAVYIIQLEYRADAECAPDQNCLSVCLQCFQTQSACSTATSIWCLTMTPQLSMIAWPSYPTSSGSGLQVPFLLYSTALNSHNLVLLVVLYPRAAVIPASLHCIGQLSHKTVIAASVLG